MNDDHASQSADTGEAEVEHMAPRAPAPDAVATVQNLIALIVDVKGCKSRLRAQHDALAAVTAAQAKLAADRAAFAEYEKKTRAEISEEVVALQKRRAAVHEAEGSLDERHKFIAELERKWHNLGESDEVIRGFKSPELGAIEKARRAHVARTGFDGIAEFPPEVSLTHDVNPDDERAGA
jgi:hypothetical protein